MRWLVAMVLAMMVVAAAGHVPAEATVSGEDGLIAFVSDRSGVNQVYVIEVDGSGLRQVTDFDGGLPSPYGWSLDWSPDGTRIAFDSTRNAERNFIGQIYTIAVAGGAATLVSREALTEVVPAWSPDGTMLAFAGLPTNSVTPPWEIYVSAADGSGKTRVTNNAQADSSPSWSNDDRLLISRYRNRTDRSDIVIIDAAGGNEEDVLTGPANDSSCHWRGPAK